MDAKGTQCFGDEPYGALRSQAKPKIPISRKPKCLVQSAGLKHRAWPENRGWDGDEILNQKALDK
jgi:hypothetical protein